MSLKKTLIKLLPCSSWRENLLDKYCPKKEEFSFESIKHALMVAPHPDDEMLGAGGVLLKYADKFDCICIASAGVQTPNITAEARADIRIKEFQQVMDAIGIKNRWIFKTFGVPPMNDQIEKYFDDYCKVLDTKKYDCIFLPHPKDNHSEHQYITNKLFKRILKRKGYNPKAKIVFYEVWAPIMIPNYFEDISDVFFKKQKCLEMYASQNGWINYPDRIEGLNKYRGMIFNNVAYAEAYRVCAIKKYLKRNLNV